MESKYIVIPQKSFERKLHLFYKKDRDLYTLIIRVMGKLEVNPFDRLLHTHKVNSVKDNGAYSSRVTGNIRIIWVVQGSQIIILLDVGGHSGSKKVYK